LDEVAHQSLSQVGEKNLYKNHNIGGKKKLKGEGGCKKWRRCKKGTELRLLGNVAGRAGSRWAGGKVVGSRKNVWRIHAQSIIAKISFSPEWSTPFLRQGIPFLRRFGLGGQILGGKKGQKKTGKIGEKRGSSVGCNVRTTLCLVESVKKRSCGEGGPPSSLLRGVAGPKDRRSSTT